MLQTSTKKEYTIEIGMKRRLILDGSQGATTLGPVGELGFFLRDAENGPVTTVVGESRLLSQGQSEDPPALPRLPSLLLPQTITMEHEILLPKNLEFLGLGGSGYVREHGKHEAMLPRPSVLTVVTS